MTLYILERPNIGSQHMLKKKKNEYNDIKSLTVKWFSKATTKHAIERWFL